VCVEARSIHHSDQQQLLLLHLGHKRHKQAVLQYRYAVLPVASKRYFYLIGI
jgi:hypothetical protein